MEIHALRVSISEKDLNDLARRHLPEDQPIEDMGIQVGPEGVRIHGVYPLFVNVSFETHWELGVRAGRLTARLAAFRALGIPGNIFKSAILKMAADLAGARDWLQMEMDTLLLDLDRLLLSTGLSARTNFSRVACEPGMIIFEANG